MARIRVHRYTATSRNDNRIPCAQRTLKGLSDRRSPDATRGETLSSDGGERCIKMMHWKQMKIVGDEDQTRMSIRDDIGFSSQGPIWKAPRGRPPQLVLGGTYMGPKMPLTKPSEKQARPAIDDAPLRSASASRTMVRHRSH